MKRPKRDPFWPKQASALADEAPAGAGANAGASGYFQRSPSDVGHPPTGAGGLADRPRTPNCLFLPPFGPPGTPIPFMDVITNL